MVSKNENDSSFASYGTILEVKDAVHLHDGRSILTTVGVRRFKILEKGEQVRIFFYIVVLHALTPNDAIHLELRLVFFCVASNLVLFS